MSKEIPQQPEGFGFTRQEQLYYRVSAERFTALLRDEHTQIHHLTLDSNDYGEFLFVSLSRPVGEGREAVVLYGLGYHERRERWITDEWFWYQTGLTPGRGQEPLSYAQAKRQLEARRAEIAPYSADAQQSERGKWFELLADLTDEDAAAAEFDDLADFFDL